MLNPKAKNHKEQARKDSSDALHIQSFATKC